MPTPTDELRAGGSPGSSVPLRVFFAVWPDAAARDVIAARARDVVQRVGGRAPRPENHHLTLAFVGEVDADRIDALKSIGVEAARGVAPFVLALDLVGEFHHTAIAWLGAGTPPAELERLVRALRDGLAAEGFPVELRHYRAHVTLARRCGTLAAATIAPVAWRVERLTLIASEPLPAGRRYRELAAWSLDRTMK